VESGSETYAWSVRAGATALLAALDQHLVEQALTQHGEETSTGDLDAIRRRGSLRMLTENSPLTYYLHQGQRSGFDYELMLMAARSLGVDLRRLRLLIVLGTAAAVGASVAVAGAIGFVGLVIPHLLRPFCGGRPSRLLPASALGGAAMLLASDIAVRIIAPDQDLKLGVLTALVGAPFFLHLLWRMRGVEA
jgi:ABC-type cobalamin transport system permease subunit